MKNSKSKTTPVNQKLTPEQFVIAWQKATSPSQLARELGRPPSYVSCRAAYYRKRGIPLKLSPRGRGQTLDVPALTELANKCKE